MRLRFSALLLLSFAISPAIAQAQVPPKIGSAVAVVNLVTAAYNQDTRSLAQGDAVHQNEIIEVGLDASSELKLDDETKLALGPGSKLALDKFVYDPAKRDGSIVLNLAKGAFRFMTGVAAKPTYVVRTPVASITVRGTIFDIYVMDDGMVWMLLHEGAIQICNDRGKCRLLDEPGKLIRVLSNGDVGSPVRWASLPGRESTPFQKAFPFVVKAPSIDPTPIFTEDGITGGILPPVIKPPKGPKPPQRAESDDDTPSTKPPKTPKKTAEKDKPKRTKSAKKGSDYQEQIITGMDIAIGIGGGIGRRGGGRPGGGGGKGGDYPRMDPKMMPR